MMHHKDLHTSNDLKTECINGKPTFRQGRRISPYHSGKAV